MSRHIAAIAAVLLAATACTTSSNDTKPDTTTSSGLAAEWGPKLHTATDGKSAVCNQVGDQACAEHLTDIALTVGRLEGAIADAGGPAAYPQTSTLIEQNNTAVAAYTDHECLGDENAGVQGSPCPDDVQSILSSGAALPLALQADEK